MAEILGAVASGLTVAGLVKVCLEAFDLIQVARNQGVDYEKLTLRLNIERARLYTWGQAMGLTNPDEAADNALHGSPFQSLVRDTLELIIRLFQDGNKLQSTYGCAVYREASADGRLGTASGSGNHAVETLLTSFAHFRIHSEHGGRPMLVTKTKWMIRDRTKFGLLIQEIRSLIDGLQDITKSLSTVAHQEGMMRYTIQQITDTDTLSLVTEVCQADYPDVSDAASIKVDMLTIATEQRQAIETWATAVDVDAIVSAEDQDLEELSITELKDILRRRRGLSHDAASLARPPTPPRVAQPVDSLVMEYLDKRGFTEAREAMLQEPAIFGAFRAERRWKKRDVLPSPFVRRR